VPDPILGLPLVAGRTVERCDGCRTERPLGTSTACRCAQPRWQRFCTRCVRTIEAAVCPHCLAVATENGRQLRAKLEKHLVVRGGAAGAIDHHARLRARVERTMAEFSLHTVLTPVPDWATRLIDKSVPLPPGVEHSRVKMGAVSNLRLEDAGVRVALDNLGYAGLPAEAKLRGAIEAGDSAAAQLAGWDGVIANASQEAELRSASESLLASDTLAGTLLESIKKRDVTRVVDAAVRRGRAVDACRHALGIA
jgi:hypothetical protein